MLFVLSVPPKPRHLRGALVSVKRQRFLFENLAAAEPEHAVNLQ